jgi:hypothetical protein
MAKSNSKGLVFLAIVAFIGAAIDRAFVRKGRR